MNKILRNVLILVMIAAIVVLCISFVKAMGEADLSGWLSSLTEKTTETATTAATTASAAPVA